MYDAMDTGRALHNLEAKWSQYYTVAIVRNPVERLLSAYLMLYGEGMREELADSTSLKPATHFHNFMIRNVLTTTTKLADPDTDASISVTLGPCTGDAMANISPFWQHFYPQHCRCGLERGVAYTLVGKVEQMDDVIESLAEANVLDLQKLNEAFRVPKNAGFEKDPNLLFRIFSLGLLDTTIRVRANEIRQLNYTREVAQIRKRLLAYQYSHPKLANSLNSIFRQESMEAQATHAHNLMNGRLSGNRKVRGRAKNGR
jgi:hypothetical protein